MSKTRKISIAVIVVVVVALLGFFTYQRASACKPKKVTICHGTTSVTKPYDQLSVFTWDIDGHGKHDHMYHTGALVTTEAGAVIMKDAGEQWGDIIPDKMNWTEVGKAMYDNDCKYVDVCEWDNTILPTDENCFDPTPCEWNEEILATDDQCFEPCEWNATIPSDDVECVAPTPEPTPEPAPTPTPVPEPTPEPMPTVLPNTGI